MRSLLLALLTLLTAGTVAAQDYVYPGPSAERPFSREAVLIDVFAEGQEFVFQIDGQGADAQNETSLPPGGSLVIRPAQGLDVMITFREITPDGRDPLIGADTINARGGVYVGGLVAAQVNDAGRYIAEVLVCSERTEMGCAQWTAARPAAPNYEGTGFVLNVSPVGYSTPTTGGGARPVRPD